MIAYIAPHAAGNAIRLLLHPPMPATSWRVLRKLTDTFTGPNDPDAFVVYDGDGRYFLDLRGLVNNTAVYYRVYYFTDGVLLSETPTKSVTPKSTFGFQSTDAVSIVRDRLDLGLQSLVARGILKHPRSLIPVMIASPLLEEIVPPLVTVHKTSDVPGARGLGELLETEQVEGGGDLAEGWLSDYQLNIIGWSLNSDQRKLLGDAIKHVLIANLPIFEACELDLITTQFSDQEDFETYQVPMYMSNCTMRFQAPSSINIPQDQIITDIQLTVSV